MDEEYDSDDAAEMYESNWMMYFNALKLELCALLYEAGFACAVGDDVQQSQKISTPEHLGCSITIYRGLNIESTECRHFMTIDLIQPQVAWLQIGPLGLDGEIKTPYTTHKYNVHDVHRVFRHFVEHLLM
jgi:hypothetical protein